MVRPPRLAFLLPLALAVSAIGQTVNYSEHIAPIIYNNCVTCHRSGQVTPFTLTSYADVAKHAPTIAAVTQSRYMPPWKAERGWVAYRDTRGLTDAQIALIQTWVANGMPQGDPAKEPALPKFSTDWQLGTPDLVLQMPAPFTVPADGPDIYRNFVLRTGLTSDKYVKAMEIRSSAPTVMHHVLFYTDATGDGRKMDGADGQPGFPGFGSVFTLGATTNPLAAINNAIAGGLGGWVPGATPEFLPDGIAYSLPNGADLILQSHFHPDGKVEQPQLTVALYFAPKPPRDIYNVQAPAFFGIQANIDIPAGQSSYMVRNSYTLPVDVDVFSVSAHAHYLGKGSRLTATLPTGEVRILLWIKDWDFNWQDTYILKDLMTLPKGTRIDGELIYDNSAANPRNPFSPPRRVRWGENSTDEMGSLILNVVPHAAADGDTLKASMIAYASRTAPAVGNKPLFLSAGVVDGASQVSGTVTPGKIVTLYGARMAASALAVPQAADGKLPNSLSGVQVLFDNIPAPLLYTSGNQLGAVVPYAVDGKAGTQVVVKNGTLASDPVALPVAAANPGIFSFDGSGAGQGAILNQDQTVNGSKNPATAGSVIVLFATGEGQTKPAGVDGQIAATVFPAPVLPVSVTIGGVKADVLYAGAAPGAVAGAMQINARIPAGLAPGDQAVQVTVGTAASQPGITVSVR
jgi:uncharacterized protein (TIGR03437 family)